ncbi:MAG TPA: hypothetical protein VFT33_03925 [Gaiellaceae bacterium]|nr:hypothetical protein [Gaiellaceae bacterium]
MSEGVERRLIDAEPAKPVEGSADVPRSERARRAGYRRRFAVIYGSLALIGGIAIGALLVLISRPDAVPNPAWSSWEPTGSSNAQVLQIADHVAKQYKFQGDQLVVALGGPPTITDAGNTNAEIPIRAIAVRPDTSTGQAEEDDIQLIDASQSMEYVLCGLGDACSISQGAPTEARGTFLRRQALELALYTFKYVDGVDSVTVILPPLPGGQTPPSAVFLKRGDVKSELSKPLSQTLAPITPTIGTIKATELQTLNRITRPRLYQVGYTQAQDASPVLILSPVP